MNLSVVCPLVSPSLCQKFIYATHFTNTFVLRCEKVFVKERVTCNLCYGRNWFFFSCSDDIST